MLSAIPKDVRENMARAAGYLRRNEVERALTAMASALRQCVGLHLMRGPRAEMDIHICDFLNSLVHNQNMQPLLDPGHTGKPRNIPFHQGQESQMATVLDGLAKILHEEAEDTIRRETEARLERKKSLIENGVQLLNDGQVAKGRAFLKRVAEEFTEEPGIRIQLGQILASSGQFAEAAEMFEDSIEKYPRESAAYTGAINAWMAIYEFEKAETIYNAILRTFGGHPNTFGKMAQMYLAWRRRPQAEDMAERALQEDPRQPEALAVLAALKAKK